MARLVARVTRIHEGEWNDWKDPCFIDTANPVCDILRVYHAQTHAEGNEEAMQPCILACEYDYEEFPRSESEDDRIRLAAYILLSYAIDKVLVDPESMPTGVTFCITELPIIYWRARRRSDEVRSVLQKTDIAFRKDFLRELLSIATATKTAQHDSLAWSLDDAIDIIRRHYAAMVIQSAFRESICNPSMRLCQSRLKRDFALLLT